MASKFAALGFKEAPARMTILHPVTLRPLVNSMTGEEAYIDLLPAQSQVGTAADRDTQDSYLRLRRRVTAEDTEKATTLKLGKLTVGWSLALLNGAPLDIPCTPDNAMDLYGEIRWMRDQVSSFVTDLGNFPSNTSAISADTPNTSAG
jgi:hypothetical protein